MTDREGGVEHQSLSLYETTTNIMETESETSRTNLLENGKSPFGAIEALWHDVIHHETSVVEVKH